MSIPRSARGANVLDLDIILTVNTKTNSDEKNRMCREEK